MTPEQIGTVCAAQLPEAQRAVARDQLASATRTDNLRTIPHSQSQYILNGRIVNCVSHAVGRDLVQTDCHRW
jgi:hypothetical protein